MGEQISERLRGQLGRLRVPQATDRVYKDECMLSFDTPYSPNGIFINLQTYQAYGADWVEWDYQRTGNIPYLHHKKIAIAKPTPDPSAPPPEKKPKQIAIGVEEGFDIGVDRPQYFDQYSVTFLPDFFELPLPDVTQSLPTLVQMVIDSIIKAESASRKDDVSAWVLDKPRVSKFALTLQQLENGVKVPPSGWKCAHCDLTENLWMNLTDGTILCGRRNWDGSGGNGHALQYYTTTQYPLCVKLGTISASNDPDVYSYAEDDMVQDPLIVKHLQHFGIEIAAMTKTEKSIAELEVDQNLKFEFSRIQESGKQLTPLAGPGYTGLENIGSSCYVASVVQVLFSLDPFQQRYFANAKQILQGSPADPVSDLTVQLAKLADGLLSGRYSTIDGDGIAPRAFKKLVGKGHPEFSTNRQQDAMEFFQYLLTLIERQERATNQVNNDPSLVFKFGVEDRVQCSVSGKVVYRTRVDNIISLPVPLEQAINAAEVAEFERLMASKSETERKAITWDDRVRPIIPLEACFQAFAADEQLLDFFSTATGQKGAATKRTRISTFPPYLMLHMRKFTVNADWTPAKLDVRFQVPDELDLEWLRAHGLQPGEELLPEGEPAAAQPAAAAPAAQPAAAAAVVVPDPSLLNQLVEMGFHPEGCKKALFYTQNRGLEDAMNWVLEHMEDNDFTTPFVQPGAAKNNAATASEEDIEMLINMGFVRDQAIKALKSTNNNLERAADWLFSHSDDLDAMVVDEVAPAAAAAPTSTPSNLLNGPSRYRLRAFISHMGPSTSSGHYVCHILKEGRWVFFNDSKVALSEDPPREFAYLYLFERKDFD